MGILRNHYAHLVLSLFFIPFLLSLGSFDERIFNSQKRAKFAGDQSLLASQEIIDQSDLFSLIILGDHDATGVMSDAVDSFKAPNLRKC